MAEPLTISPAPVILCSAPNGARRTRADHAGLPMTSDDIADCAVACRDAGAALLHLHVRDGEGRHCLDAEAYREATAAVRHAVGDSLIVQITTEAVGRYSPAEQMAVVRDLRPEAVSIALRELIPDASHEAEAAAFLGELSAWDCMVQHILYAPTEVDWMCELMRRGIIPDSPVFPLFVLGRYAEGQRSNPADIAGYVQKWASGDKGAHRGHHLLPPWSVCAFGPEETSCAVAALSMGGHARVGFENNLWRPDGTVARDPAEPVTRLADVAELIHRPLASADQARAILLQK